MVGREGKEEEVSGVRWDEIGSVVERDGTGRDGTGFGAGAGAVESDGMGWQGMWQDGTGLD